MRCAAAAPRAQIDVLEALNRLLDDNRELFVPELQQTVRSSV